jgi:hypothetical protein
VYAVGAHLVPGDPPGDFAVDDVWLEPATLVKMIGETRCGAPSDEDICCCRISLEGVTLFPQWFSQDAVHIRLYLHCKLL